MLENKDLTAKQTISIHYNSYQTEFILRMTDRDRVKKTMSVGQHGDNPRALKTQENEPGEPLLSLLQGIGTISNVKLTKTSKYCDMYSS